MLDHDDKAKRIYATHFKGAITFLLDDIEKILGAAHDELKTTLNHILEEIKKCEGELHIDVPEEIIKGSKELYIEKLAECLQEINDCYNQDYLPDVSIKQKIVSDSDIAEQFKVDCEEHFTAIIEDLKKKIKITGLLASIQEDIGEILKQQDEHGGPGVQHNQDELYQKSLQYLKKILRTVDEQQISAMSYSQEALQYLNKILEVEDKQSTTNIQTRNALQFLKKIAEVENKPHASGADYQNDEIMALDVEKILNIKYEKHTLNAKDNKNKLQELNELLKIECKEYIPKIKITQLEEILEKTYKNPKLSSQDNKIPLQDLQQIVKVEHEKYKWHEWFQKTWPRNEQGIILHHNFEQLNKVAGNSPQHDHLLAIRNRLINAYYLQSEEQEAQKSKLYQTSTQQEQKLAREKKPLVSIEENILVKKGLLSKEEAPYLDYQIYQIIVEALTPPEMPEIPDDESRRNINAAFDNIDIIFNNTKQLFEIARSLYPGNPGKCFEELNKVTDQRIMSLIKIEDSKRLPAITTAIKNGLLTFNQITKFSIPELDELSKCDGPILHYAISTGNKSLVETILLRNKDLIDSRDERGLTPLQLALNLRKLDIAEFLIESGAKGGLHYAISAGNKSLVETILLQNKDLIDSRDERGLAPLQLALNLKKLDIAEFLIESGAKGGLHYAISAGNKSLVKTALSRNEDLIDSRDKRGLAPLHWAIKLRHYDVAEVLIQNGAQVNIRDQYDRTPLFYARGENYIKCATILLKNEADPNIQDKNGVTPLMRAVGSNCVENVNLLLENGADPNAQDKDGVTALFRAVFRNNSKISKVLLEHGGDPNIPAPYARTALGVSIKRGKNEISKMLLEYGADPNIPDGYGLVPLRIAVSKNYQSVKMLLEKGANPNVIDRKGDTPICYTKGTARQLLFEHGAIPARGDKMNRINDTNVRQVIETFADKLIENLTTHSKEAEKFQEVMMGSNPGDTVPLMTKEHLPMLTVINKSIMSALEEIKKLVPNHQFLVPTHEEYVMLLNNLSANKEIRRFITCYSSQATQQIPLEIIKGLKGVKIDDNQSSPPSHVTQLKTKSRSDDAGSSWRR